MDANDITWVLPTEILTHIASFLDSPDDFLNLALTSRRFVSVLASPLTIHEAKVRISRPVWSMADKPCRTWYLPNSTKYGTEEEWNGQGVQTGLVHWVDGKRNGTTEEWNDQGVRTYLSHWVYDKPHGTVEWWNDQGVRTCLRHWKDGKQHGTEEQWNDQGVRTCLSHWVDGKRHGTGEIWNGQGVRTRLTHWVDGLIYY